MCIESGRLSFVASQQHVPVACAAAHAWREIEAALGGPLAVADIDGRSFIAKLWLIASVADAVSHARRR